MSKQQRGVGLRGSTSQRPSSFDGFSSSTVFELQFLSNIDLYSTALLRPFAPVLSAEAAPGARYERRSRRKTLEIEKDNTEAIKDCTQRTLLPDRKSFKPDLVTPDFYSARSNSICEHVLTLTNWKLWRRLQTTEWFFPFVYVCDPSMIPSVW